MLRSFLKDTRANYTMMTVFAMVPLAGAIALAADYSELTREKRLTSAALDAANIATAQRYIQGATTAQLNDYALNFFKANLNDIDPSKVVLTVIPPDDQAGGGTMKMTATMSYKPMFLPMASYLLGQSASTDLKFAATSEVRLKDTLEVSLVLDNSGSMSEKGGSSSKIRMDLVKGAAKQLVEMLAQQGSAMKQISKPVQFSLVPFAGSVNVGPGNSGESWMDTSGISPIHHENFDWSTMAAADPNKRVEMSGGVYYKKGTGWGTQQNQVMTRFTLFNDLQRISGWNNNVSATAPGAQYYCTRYNSNGTCRSGYYRTPNYAPYASWEGCVEARPYPYDIDDTTPSSGNPASLFVPMFAPDESDRVAGSYNTWWADQTGSLVDATRQKYMPKYYAINETGAEGTSIGPNQGCTTSPITKLTDVTDSTGLNTIETAIDAMSPNGATNVPEGMAWGWRTISSGAPFTEGRPETEKGNDKVLIVLTDGANTYYTPESLGSLDLAGNKSIYSSIGYAGKAYNGTSTSRIFMGTSNAVSKSNYSNSNYTTAMNEHFAALCTNAKAAGVMVMTVAVDLNMNDAAEKTQADMLKACSSDSRYSKNADGTSKKLFWNSTGSSLSTDFQSIGNELSNLRIVS